jgi:hypothetical protein
LEEVPEGISKLKAYIQARFGYVATNFAAEVVRKVLHLNEKTAAYCQKNMARKAS